MTIETKTLIETFKAKDSFGQVYTVHRYQNFISQSTSGGSSRSILGLMELQCNGSPVHTIDDSTFKLISPETVLHKLIE